MDTLFYFKKMSVFFISIPGVGVEFTEIVLLMSQCFLYNCLYIIPEPKFYGHQGVHLFLDDGPCKYLPHNRKQIIELKVYLKKYFKHVIF